MNKHFFRLSCCFFIAAILSSCSGNQKAAPMTENGMTVIPFESAVQDERELSMSDFVANVDYIPTKPVHDFNPSTREAEAGRSL